MSAGFQIRARANTWPTAMARAVDAYFAAPQLYAAAPKSGANLKL